MIWPVHYSLRITDDMMIHSWLQPSTWWTKYIFPWLGRLTVLCTLITGLWSWNTPMGTAGISDDRFDGNIFALYASNGSLVPPKENLDLALQKHRPAVIMFYADDSLDCKENALMMTQLQAFYRQFLSLIPVTVDAIRPDTSYGPTESPYYYNGNTVPQFVILNQDGEVVFDKTGVTSYLEVDDVLRGVFDLDPRPDDFVLGTPDFSPSPSADTTFWTAPVRSLETTAPATSKPDL